MEIDLRPLEQTDGGTLALSLPVLERCPEDVRLHKLIAHNHLKTQVILQYEGKDIMQS